MVKQHPTICGNGLDTITIEIQDQWIDRTGPALGILKILTRRIAILVIDLAITMTQEAVRVAKQPVRPKAPKLRIEKIIHREIFVERDVVTAELLPVQSQIDLGRRYRRRKGICGVRPELAIGSQLQADLNATGRP